MQCDVAPGGWLCYFTGFEWYWAFVLAAPSDEAWLPELTLDAADPLGPLDLQISGFIFTGLAACEEIDIRTVVSAASKSW